MSKSFQKIILIGAGNVGYHLGSRLVEQGLPLQQIYSRTIPKARSLARKIDISYTTQFKRIAKDGDLYILAVKDDAIATVAEQLQQAGIPQTALIVHTSGSTPSTVLAPFFKNYGIFYPLQTFSIDRPVNFSSIPICIFSNVLTSRTLLQNLGKRIGDKVTWIDDRQRSILHIAAVFVNNFSNHLFQIGEQITQESDLSFDLLRPLILETAQKVQEKSPTEMQTGPAIRKDAKTIERHLNWLERNPEWREIYVQLTKSIDRSFGNKK